MCVTLQQEQTVFWGKKDIPATFSIAETKTE